MPMLRLSAAETLALRDCGAGLHAIDRALLVLGTVDPAAGRDALARLPLGVRDARLLAARRLAFGDRLEAEADCPACGERLELALACSDLLARAAPPPAEWIVEHDGCRITVRPLDSLDAAAAARCETPATARDLLFARCVVAAQRAGAPIAADALPDAAREAVAESLATRDAGAEWLLDLACPACANRWASALDVADFVWRELAACGERVLREVHALARAYGWREAEILALPPARRAAYLALCGGV
jgi:hypothetical protein